MIDTPYVHSMSFEKAVEAKPLVHDTDTLFDMRIIRMRQIKFRHYDKRLNNFLIFELLPVGIARDETIVSFDKDRLDSPIEQYTGLKDVNGVEIYEGDIVKWDDSSNGKCWRVAIVEWDNAGQWAFNVKAGVSVNCYQDTGHVFKMGSFMYSPDVNKYGNQLYVIGNVHQNPELLEQNDD